MSFTHFLITLDHPSDKFFHHHIFSRRKFFRLIYENISHNSFPPLITDEGMTSSSKGKADVFADSSKTC